MKDLIHKYFQVSTIRWMVFPPAWYDSFESLQLIAQDDFLDAIELSQIKDDALQKATKETLEQSHLKVCYGAQPRLLGPKLSPNATAEEERALAEQALLEVLDEIEYLGARGTAFLAGKWEEATKDQAYFQLIKTTCNVYGWAAEKGMIVELEVFDSDMDKAALIDPAPYAAKFVSDVRTYCNNFDLVADLSHLPTAYETSKFVIQTSRPYIIHLRMGNAVVKEGFDAYGDLHSRFGYPNNANDTEQLLDFFAVLKEEGFFNAKSPLVLSSEVSPHPHENAHIILANTKRVVDRVWALLED